MISLEEKREVVIAYYEKVYRVKFRMPIADQIVKDLYNKIYKLGHECPNLRRLKDFKPVVKEQKKESETSGDQNEPEK